MVFIEYIELLLLRFYNVCSDVYLVPLCPKCEKSVINLQKQEIKVDKEYNSDTIQYIARLIDN